MTSTREDYSKWTTAELVRLSKSNQIEAADKSRLIVALGERIQELLNVLNRF